MRNQRAIDYKIIPLTPNLLRTHIYTVLKLDNEIIAENWNEENFIMELPQKWNVSQIVLKSDIVIGFMIANSQTDSIHINRIVVDREFRGLGIGKELLNIAKNYAIKTQKKRVTIKVSPQNHGAIDYYIKYGFVINHYTQQNISLSLSLSP